MPSPRWTQKPPVRVAAAAAAAAACTCAMLCAMPAEGQVFVCVPDGGGAKDYRLQISDDVGQSTSSYTCKTAPGGQWDMADDAETCCGNTGNTCPCVPERKYADDHLGFKPTNLGSARCTTSTCARLPTLLPRASRILGVCLLPRLGAPSPRAPAGSLHSSIPLLTHPHTRPRPRAHVDINCVHGGACSTKRSPTDYRWGSEVYGEGVPCLLHTDAPMQVLRGQAEQAGLARR